MTRSIDIQVGDARGRIRLLDDEAPQTAQAIWEMLPLEDRTVPVRWSGNAWRSEQDHTPSFTEVENRPDYLEAGEVAYYPRSKKICFAYGVAQWRMPDGSVIPISVFGRVDQGLDALVAASERAHTEGSVVYRLSRHGEDGAG